MMEVGLLVRVPDSPGAAPDQAGQYQIPVSIKGGTYQALVDSGCNQTSIYQSLMQQRALDTSRKVKVRCVHGNVADYPLVPVSIQFRGKMHRMEVAVNPHLKHPLILGTDWPAFTQLLGIVCADVSWQTGRGQEEAAAQAGEALAGPSPPASEETRASEGVKPPELDDFPLEQSRDEMLKNAFDRVRSVDGQLLQPDVPLSFPYFSILERPVLYLSRKLSKRETRYSTVEKECLAIRWAILTLRYYLLGREFTLCSHHAPLQWLNRMKDTNARITRWYLALQPFKFKVVHRPGDADGCSRLPL